MAGYLFDAPGGLMFDDPFVFFALVIAIDALIFARKAMIGFLQLTIAGALE